MGIFLYFSQCLRTCSGLLRSSPYHWHWHTTSAARVCCTHPGQGVRWKEEIKMGTEQTNTRWRSRYDIEHLNMTYSCFCWGSSLGRKILTDAGNVFIELKGNQRVTLVSTLARWPYLPTLPEKHASKTRFDVTLYIDVELVISPSCLVILSVTLFI